MHVGIEGEAEVAGVVGAVDRLLERAQEDRLQQGEVRPLADALKELRVVGGARDLAAGQLQADLGEERAQRAHLLGRGHVVHAVQHRMSVLGDEIAGADVGRQHAFLDQAMGIVARLRDDFLDLAASVEQHARLDGFEVDRAAALALPEQQLEDLVENNQMFFRRFV